MLDWYYAIDGQQFGPVGDRELHDLAGQGSIQPTDLVWRDGFGDWAAASTVAGLFPAGGVTPPAPPVQSFSSAGSREFDDTEMEFEPIDTDNPYAAHSAVAGGAYRTPEELKIPLLISGISSCAFAVIWSLTCIFSILALPLGILAWYEFSLYKKIDKIPNAQFGAEAKKISLYQIIAGVLTGNIPSLVCGILLMIKGGEHEQAGFTA